MSDPASPNQPSEEQRFLAAYDACATRVLAYALRHTDPESAHDVVAEVFLVAWRRIGVVPDEALPWLLVVARNVLANRRRSRVRRAQLASRLADVAATPTSPSFAPGAEEVAVERGAMLQALATLTESEREALLLVAWDGLAIVDAARVAGCSRNAFEARLHRARTRLERACSPDPPGARTPTTDPVLREART